MHSTPRDTAPVSTGAHPSTTPWWAGPTRCRRLLLQLGLALLAPAAQAAMPVPLVQEIRLQFLDNGGHQSIGFFERGQVMPPLQAQIRYQGRGLLRARWEVIEPGDPQPDLDTDLRPEMDLAAEPRARQHRYTVLKRVNLYLAPTGFATLPGPPPALLPNGRDGHYTVLLRLEQAALTQNVAVVLPMRLPVLRYHIGQSAGPAMRGSAPPEPLRVVAPQGLVFSDRPLSFSWQPQASAKLYRLEVQRDGQLVYAARVPPEAGSSGLTRFTLPGFAQQQLGTAPMRWRVVTLANDGSALNESRWVDLQWAAVR